MIAMLFFIVVVAAGVTLALLLQALLHGRDRS